LVSGKGQNGLTAKPCVKIGRAPLAAILVVKVKSYYFLLTKLSAKRLNTFNSKIYYSTYLLLTSVNFILVVWLTSVDLERGDRKKSLLSFFLFI